MNFFTRRVVFVSDCFEQTSQMRAKIHLGLIECWMSCKTLNPSKKGPFYEPDSLSRKEYRLYVHKRDVQQAISLMNQPGF